MSKVAEPQLLMSARPNLSTAEGLLPAACTNTALQGPTLLAERPVQLRGSRVARALLGLAGWRVEFNGLAARQGVLVVYPHTSNWDFPVGVLAKWAIGVPVTIWGKDTLFGAWLRWLGGVPVNRHSPRGIVGDMVQRVGQARDHDEFMWLALAPEGTRALSHGWRSGFYQVALGAGVPLGLAALDFKRRRVVFNTFLRLSGNATADMAEIARRLGGMQGCRPAWAAPIRLL